MSPKVFSSSSSVPCLSGCKLFEFGSVSFTAHCLKSSVIVSIDCRVVTIGFSGYLKSKVERPKGSESNCFGSYGRASLTDHVM